MPATRPHPVLLLLAAAIPAPAHAADPPLEVGVLVEHIRVDQATAARIMRDFRGDAPALRKHLQTLVENRRADLLESAYVIARDGSTAKIASVHEFIYPTEYDPPVTPTRIAGAIAGGIDLTTPANPTAYDVRDLGNILEVSAAVERGTGLIKLQLSPEVTEHTGKLTYGKDKSTATQPIFYRLRTQTQVRVRSDRYALLALLTPRASENKPEEKTQRDRDSRVFVMLRATVLDNPDQEK